MKNKLFLLFFLFVTPLLSFAELTNAVDSAALSKKLHELTANKTFAEMKQELQQLDKSLSAPLPSCADDTDDNTQVYAPIVTFANIDVKTEYENYSKLIKFEQYIYGDRSEIILKEANGEDINRNSFDYLPDYTSYQYSLPTFIIKKAYFQDGSSLDVDKSERYVMSNKRIIAIDLITQYQIAKTPMTKLTFAHNTVKTQQGISLLAIDKNCAIFEMPKGEKTPSSGFDLVSNKILEVEALNSQGLVLRKKGMTDYGISSLVNSPLKWYIQSILSDIENNKITDKETLLKYVENNYNRALNENKSNNNNNNNNNIIIGYRYNGNIETINIYLAPDQEMDNISIQTRLPDSKTQYVNGIMIANKEIKSYNEGLINEQGEWIINPNHTFIKHIIDNYYLIDNDHSLYYLDINNKKLLKQPFYVTDATAYQNKFIIINKSANDNSLQGLFDVKNRKTVLAEKYHHIDIGDYFYIASRANINEIYNNETNQKLYTAKKEASIAVDKNNFIIGTKICAKKPPHDYECDFEFCRHIDLTEPFCYYHNFNLYNHNGKKVNQQPFDRVYGKFDLNNLLLVAVNKQLFFINRQAEKLNVNLSLYKKIRPFSNGLAAVQCLDNGLYGYINNKGEQIIPCLYSSAYYFQAGSALVKDQQYQLIKPDNSVLKKFTEHHFIYNPIEQDTREPIYSFEISINGDKRFIKYNAKGEIINENNE